jgi:hypothetical protein
MSVARTRMLTLAVLLGTVAVVGDGVPMSWRGRRFDSALVPEGMPDRVRAAVDLLRPWAT